VSDLTVAAVFVRGKDVRVSSARGSHVRRTPGARTRREVALAAVVVVLLGVAAVYLMTRGAQVAAPNGAATRPDAAGTTAVAPTEVGAAPTVAVTTPPPQPRILFGMGTEADSARFAGLVQRAPVRMLTSWYNGPNDLSWMTGWRTGTVAASYAAGFAMHLVVYTNDPEVPLTTSYGPACGRAYPLSDRFPDDMRKLAQTFAGAASGPPLYVTMFTEFQTYPCDDNAWSPNAATTAYYLALKERYTLAFQVFHQYAPNARVSLGWGGWQAGFDQPERGGGRSMFPHFADVMRMSDFQSFQAMNGSGNVADIAAMVSTLGQYGPVMLAHYKPDNGSQATFDADVRAILTNSFLSEMTAKGLFAMSFMDAKNLDADPGIFEFAQHAVATYAGAW
jgi:hypothetical protein